MTKKRIYIITAIVAILALIVIFYPSADEIETYELSKTNFTETLSASAQSFFQMDGMISHIEIQIPRVFEAKEIARELEKQYPGYQLVSWQENNQQLLTALNSQSSSSYVIQFFVILAITLGIASVLAINVVQKDQL